MVAEYQSQFLSLLARCDGLVEKHQINVFTAGLCNPLKTDIELEHPATLKEAMALAHAYEQRLSMTDLPPARSSPLLRSSLGRNPGSSRSLLLTAPSPAAGAEDKPSAAPRFKRLTTAEMAVKQEKGECYNCTEQFSLEHLKTCPMKGIYLLQLDDDTPTNELLLKDDPNISLNAVTSLASTDTMQLAVRLTDHTVGTLIDSGSTHSFISVLVAARLDLDPLHQFGLHVKVANSDCVACASVCRATHIYIDEEEFVVVLFVIPLEGFDMVLGVQWLRTLEPILWDFNCTSMSCWRDGHRVVWHGMASCGVFDAVHALLASDLMFLLHQEFKDVFATPIGLPPPRCHNHQIHLLHDSPPVVVRPYPPAGEG
jgi:hypothetical protein